MKKVLVALLSLLLLAALLFIGSIVYLYYSTDETVVPQVTVGALGQTIPADSYYWSHPVLGGITHREFTKEYDSAVVPLGTIEEAQLPLSLPEGCGSLITVSCTDEAGREMLSFEGSALEYAGFSFPQSGDYVLDINLTEQETAGKGWGRFHFRLAVTVTFPPEPPALAYSETTVKQGDLLALELTNAPEGIVPTAESEVCQVPFAKSGEKWVAFVPISYMREPGTYSVRVRCGDAIDEEISLAVIEGEFEVQNLTIGNTAETSEAIRIASSSEAYAEFRAAIYPLYEQADSEVHWSGSFIEPVEGYRISTPYGVKRYTNGAKTPSRHAGVDMAIAMGTPVKAPAAGRVVFAQYLLNTGNTVAIEHGAGLKTFYFHMDSLNVAAGEMVEQGQILGEVGTTGYSTGPHLHFEVRVANQAVDPFLFMNGSGGYYRLHESQ